VRRGGIVEQAREKGGKKSVFCLSFFIVHTWSEVRDPVLEKRRRGKKREGGEERRLRILSSFYHFISQLFVDREKKKRKKKGRKERRSWFSASYLRLVREAGSRTRQVMGKKRMPGSGRRL